MYSSEKLTQEKPAKLYLNESATSESDYSMGTTETEEASISSCEIYSKDSENHEASKVSVLRNSRPHIGGIEELEFGGNWNRHILTGYRIGYNTWRSIVSSLFQWHNETINIWTHLVGFVAVLTAIIYISLADVTGDA